MPEYRIKFEVTGFADITARNDEEALNKFYRNEAFLKSLNVTDVDTSSPIRLD